ncbi:MAG: YceI family protein [Deltaproteobacteria bacterium]|nr:YceI family protein [Deltaproteobacteria bacterium]
MTTSHGGTLHIFTFKHGLLSKVAHDLRLSVAKFSLEMDETQIELTIPVSQLQVDGAMKRGELREKTLSKKDKRDILDNMHKDVLRSGVYPEIRFTGNAEESAGDRQFHVTGELQLGAKTLPLRALVERVGDRLHSKVSLVPSRWGIKPFSAMLGALKVKDRVEIEIVLPAP